MKIFNEFEVLEPYPAIYIEKIKAVVISDLHLGLEELLTTSDSLFPRFQLIEIEKYLKAIFSDKKPRMIIITGDIKHEFSRLIWEERKELLDFLDFLSNNLEEVVILKGNHDNYLLSAVQHYPEIKLETEFVIEKLCFIRGHQKNLDLSKINIKHFIIGNEHPVISFRDGVSTREKIPCFLYGELDFGAKITVLPTFSKLFYGTAMNVITQKELLSPLLRENVDLNKLKVIGLSKELGIMELPELGKLRQIS